MTIYIIKPDAREISDYIGRTGKCPPLGWSECKWKLREDGVYVTDITQDGNNVGVTIDLSRSDEWVIDNIRCECDKGDLEV